MNADVLSVVIVAEGSSDSALESPVRWLINDLEIDRPLEIQISFRSQDSGTGLPGKLQTACQLFEPDLVLLQLSAFQNLRDLLRKQFQGWP